jgi:Uncharacterized protein conserved in bacteria (DUF2064)
VTTRYVAVLASPEPSKAAPPGVDPETFRLALLEDVYEVVAGLDHVIGALVLSGPDPAAETITWPGTPVLRIKGADPVAETFAVMRENGGEQAAIIAPDAPDLPSLLVGKLFRGLGQGDVVVAAAVDGGLVAIAARLPAPDWVAGIDLDTSDAPGRLRSAAGRQGAVRSSPGWRRLRTPADLDRLDPRLEGWDNTRALLSGKPL